MERIVNDYYNFLKIDKKVKVNTFLSYENDIKGYLKHINDLSIPISKIPNYFESYINKLVKTGKSVATILRNIASLRNFFNYLINRKLIDYDPTIGHKFKRKTKNQELNQSLLSVSEVSSVISCPSIEGFQGYRDRAILEILYACGLKASELLHIKLKDINLAQNFIAIVDDSENRYVSLNETAVIAVENYIQIARSSLKNINSDILFLNMFGNPLSRQSLWKIVKAYGKKANIENDITPHIFKKSMINHLIENDANIDLLKKLLGHKHKSSTKSYIKYLKK